MATTTPILDPITRHVDASIGEAFDRFLEGSQSFWFGLVLLLLFHALNFWGLRTDKTIEAESLPDVFRKAGLGMIILYIYFGADSDPWIGWLHRYLEGGASGPFCLSLWFIFGDLCAYFCCDLCRRFAGDETENHNEGRLSDAPDSTQTGTTHDGGDDARAEERMMKGQVLVANKYMKLDLQLVQVIGVFFAQGILVVLYCTYLDTDPDSHTGPKFIKGQGKGIKGLIWLASLMLQIFATRSEMGEFFYSWFWIRMYSKVCKYNPPHTTPGSGDQDADKWAKRRMKWSFVLRGFMDFLINGFAYQIILFTFPIVLLASNGLGDFLQNCTAVYFISKVDDIEDETTSSDDLIGSLYFKIDWSIFTSRSRPLGFKFYSNTVDVEVASKEEINSRMRACVKRARTQPHLASSREASAANHRSASDKTEPLLSLGPPTGSL